MISAAQEWSRANGGTEWQRPVDQARHDRKWFVRDHCGPQGNAAFVVAVTVSSKQDKNDDQHKNAKLNGQQHRLVSTQILKDMSENMSIFYKTSL